MSINSPGTTRRRQAAILSLTLLVTFVFTGWAGSSPATADAPIQPGNGSVLVFGSADNGLEGDNLATTLEGLGFEVTRHKDNLPDGWGIDHSEVLGMLLEFQSIWYIEAYEGLSDEEVNLLVEYTNAGGNLYLTGERPCCEPLNASVTALLGRVLTNNVTVGGMGDVGGPFSFNGVALAGVTTEPNLLVDFVPQSPGGMTMAGLTGVSGRNVLASSATVVVGGVWDEADMKSNKGRIALLMDIDWLKADTRKAIIQNLANFLSGGGLCSDEPDNGLSWTGGPSNCSVLTPGTYTWSARVDSGSGPYFETIPTEGVTATCQYSLTPPTASYTCDVSVAFDAYTTGEPTLKIRAVGSDPGRQLIRTHGLREKNDPRNVPVPFSVESNWWDWPDQDKDGLPDKWETDGVWVKGTLLDLPRLGADPAKKDLFVRYDYQEGHKPSQDTLDFMKRMFADAPAMEGDQGGSGVNLHVELGTEVPLSIIDSGYYALEDAAIQKVGTYTGYLNSPGYGGGGVPVIYKSILNLAQPSDQDGTIGRAYIKGVFAWTGWDLDWFGAMLSGLQLEGWDHFNFERAASFAQASNANHELGHLLGLRHHNDTPQPDECPSYQSIMSYTYNNFGLVRDGRNVLDYSRDPVSTGCDGDSSSMLDWKVGEPVGSITFIQGQHGELSQSFYNDQSDQTLATYGDKSDETGIAELIRMTDREAFEQWFRDFEAPGTPQFPTVGDASAQVKAGESVDIPLDGNDPLGGEIIYVIRNTPEFGNAQVTATGLTYTANAGVSGVEALKVSAQTALLRSDAATVTITIGSDNVGPAITWVNPIADSASFIVGSVPAAPTCIASDEDSGVDSDGCEVSGYSASPGLHTLTATATDNAGNTTTEQRTFAVRFRDVPQDVQFHDEIMWIATEGISTGWPDGTFRPVQPVSRDAMAAFLYRLAGSPSYTPPVASPFRDVDSTNQFYREITWLASTGISDGWPDGTFRPLRPIARDAMAAFLFRFATFQDPTATNGFAAPAVSPFVDVSGSQQFYAEMTWLASTGISTGWTTPSGAEYRPWASVNRDAMAAFMYRYSLTQ